MTASRKRAKKKKPKVIRAWAIIRYDGKLLGQISCHAPWLYATKADAEFGASQNVTLRPVRVEIRVVSK